MPIVIASLVILALGFFGGSEVFRWRAHHFAEIPTGHVVGFEAGGYYMRPTGWVNRTAISRHQYELFQENNCRAAALSLTGGCLWVPAVVLGLIHGRRVASKKPPAGDDLA
jgi:hypothetical protein